MASTRAMSAISYSSHSSLPILSKRFCRSSADRPDGQTAQAHWDPARGLGHSAPRPRISGLTAAPGSGRTPKDRDPKIAARDFRPPGRPFGACRRLRCVHVVDNRGSAGSRRPEIGSPRARRLIGGGRSLRRTYLRVDFPDYQGNYREFARFDPVSYRRASRKLLTWRLNFENSYPGEQGTT